MGFYTLTYGLALIVFKTKHTFNGVFFLVHQSDKAARFKTTSSETESSYLGSNAKTGKNS